jgi:hypothetical protein
MRVRQSGSAHRGRAQAKEVPMSFKTLLTVAGALGVLFGLGFLLAPSAVLAQYRVQTDPAGLFVAQLFGAGLLELGLIFFLARRVEDPPTMRGIALGACIGELAGLWIALRIQLTGLTNAMGWSSVAIYGLLALGFGRYAFGRYAATPPATP